MSRKIDQRYPAITDELAKSGYLQTQSPMLMKPERYLDTLARAQIPLTYSLVANYIDSWLASDRANLLERLLDTGEGKDLLSILVKYFLGKRLYTEKKSEPLDVIKALITPSLNSRVPDDEKDMFVYEVIGQHYDIPSYVDDTDLEVEEDDIDDPINQLLDMLFGEDYDDDNDDGDINQKNNKIFPGLRGFVSLRLIEAYQIAELEEWLWDEFGIPKNDFFRNNSKTSRDAWLIELERQSTADTVDEPEDDDYLINKARNVFLQSPLKALGLLERVQDIRRAIVFCPTFTNYAVQQGKRVEAAAIISRLYETLSAKLSSFSQEVQENALEDLLETMVLLAEAEKVIEVLRMLNGSGLEKLLSSLNIDEQTLGHYIIQVYGENPSATGNRVSNNSLNGVGKMLKALAKKRISKEVLDGLFGELLCLRLYYIGEDGVAWPPRKMWEKHPDTILNMACRVGVSPAITDDEKETRESLFLLWLSRAKQHLAPVIVPQIVGRVMAETILLTDDTEDE